MLVAFIVIAITYATAYRSGAQINPAITIALLVTGKIRAKEAALFIACQILGVVMGAAVLTRLHNIKNKMAYAVGLLAIGFNVLGGFIGGVHREQLIS